MAWSNSKIFRQFVADSFANVAALDLDSDTVKVALYNNTTGSNNTAECLRMSEHAATAGADGTSATVEPVPAARQELANERALGA